MSRGQILAWVIHVEALQCSRFGLDAHRFRCDSATVTEDDSQISLWKLLKRKQGQRSESTSVSETRVMECINFKLSEAVQVPRAGVVFRRPNVDLQCQDHSRYLPIHFFLACSVEPVSHWESMQNGPSLRSPELPLQ